jgi:guanine deaminase
MPCKKYLDFGLTVGLGSDVAGGYSLSLFNEIKNAVESSKTLHMLNAKNAQLSIEEAFYLATLGGAQALSLDNQIGSLESGKAADFVVINPSVIDPMPQLNLYKQPLQNLSKCIYRGHESMIEFVFIQGQKVRPAIH